MSQHLVGVVLDRATPVEVRFATKHPPPLGDFVIVEYYDKRRVLGMVEEVGSRCATLAALGDTLDPRVVASLSSMDGDDIYYEGKVKLLGYRSNDGSWVIPREPPKPGDRIVKADADFLRDVFGRKGREYIRLGRLVTRPEVPVHINVNKLVTRHLAVLAVTGGGKSNTIAVITDAIVRELCGTVVIFDFHGEYVNSGLGGPGRTNIIEPTINPRSMDVSEFKTLLGVDSRAYKQERILYKVWSDVVGDLSKSFEKAFEERVKAAGRRLGYNDDAHERLLARFENIREKYGNLLNESVPDVVIRLKACHANIVDLSSVDEDAADVIVSHWLRRILVERKNWKTQGKVSSEALKYPVFVVVEEAHILAPRDRGTLSKYWMARVAREGRKFGVGLAVVSQRPKNLDPDILSQANNKIILRIVEPSDQRYVREASENLSDELVAQLPGLNVGEAVVVGPMIEIPALVKIDKYAGTLGGADPDIVGEWARARSPERSGDSSDDDVIMG